MLAFLRRRLSAVVPVFIASLLTLAALAGSALMAPAASADVAPYKPNHAANVGLVQIGDPYRYGAEGPNAFDCSGLTKFTYRRAGMWLPRTAAEQYAHVHHILKMHLMRGDLVFFHDSRGHVYHVGIFMYWNKQHRAVILHAPYSGTVVHRQPVWTSAWYAGTLR